MKQLINMGIILGGLAWFWLIANNPPWYLFFIILIAGVLIPELLFPIKRNRNYLKVRTTVEKVKVNKVSLLKGDLVMMKY